MTRLVILPNHLAAEIDEKLDAAIAEHPEFPPEERDLFRAQLISFLDEHGYVPEFTLARKSDEENVR